MTPRIECPGRYNGRGVGVSPCPTEERSAPVVARKLSADDLRPGDKVEVPWGFDLLIGIVREVYGSPGKPFVMVEIPIHGSSGETLDTTTLSFPADALTLTSEAVS